MSSSAASSNERKTWIYAFTILLLVSIWILAMRFSYNPFLALDFEIIVVYLPTAVAGVITFYMIVRSERGK